MRRVKEKLKSNSGATILFAILVFMLCILAGTGALTAAAANSGRYTHLKEDQQRYLAMSSAAKLLRAELSEKTFTAKATVTETEDTAASTKTQTVEWVTSPPVTNPSYDSENLSSLLMEQLENLFAYGVYKSTGATGSGTTFPSQTARPEKLEKKLTLKAGDKVPDVKATLTVGTADTSAPDVSLTANDFTITIELNEGEKYASTLTLVATFASGAGENGLNSTQISSTTTGSTTVTVTEYTMEVSWLEGNTHIAAVPEPTETT